MKVVWAPWRMEYILSEDKGQQGCIFCPGEDRGNDRERLILYVGSRVLVIMNRYPYTNGHLLVAPMRHVPDLDSLFEQESFQLLQMVRRSVGILRQVMTPEGFNVGLNLGHIAGAGVEEHIHFHIVPRWEGDTNFMTVLGEVRVIPEHIKETYDKLSPYFLKLKDPGGGD